MIAEALDRAVRAVCPIVGVGIGRVGDKRSWRIDFAPDATPQQRTAAQSVLEAFDTTSAVDAPPRNLLAELDAVKSSVDALKASQRSK